MKSSSSYSIEDLKADPEADYSNQKLNNGQTGKDHPYYFFQIDFVKSISR